MTSTDAEPTQATAEPTIAADTINSETQSIHAWAEDDDDTELAPAPHHRGWKIPLTALTTTAAAVTAGVMVLLWPPATTTPDRPTPPQTTSGPTAAPTPHTRIDPPAPTDPDQRFMWLLHQQNFNEDNGGPAPVIAAGHKVCTNLANGETYDQVVNDIIRGSAVTHTTAAMFADTAMHQFCPEYFTPSQ